MTGSMGSDEKCKTAFYLGRLRENMLQQGRIVVLIPTLDSSGLESRVDSRFARAPYFTVVAIDGGVPSDARSFPNPAAGAAGGAGPMAVQRASELGVSVILAPSMGPNAVGAAEAMGIRAYLVPAGITVMEAVNSFLRGQLQPLAPAGPGMGAGWGGGRGMGMGMGMGRGRGRGGRGWGRGRGGGRGTWGY